MVFAFAGDSTMMRDVPRSELAVVSGVSVTGAAAARRRAGVFARFELERVRVVALVFPVRFVAMVF
jgi:hypothetical protein